MATAQQVKDHERRLRRVHKLEESLAEWLLKNKPKGSSFDGQDAWEMAVDLSPVLQRMWWER